MLFGATIFGYMIASIAGLVGSLNRSQAISNERISEITAYLTERSAPLDITKEIVRYFTHMFEQRTAYDESGILQRMPRKLRDRILLIQHSETLERIALFKYLDNDSVVLYIFDCMVMVYYEANRVILREGNFGISMLFLTHGKAKITKARSEEILQKNRQKHLNTKHLAFFSGKKKYQIDEMNRVALQKKGSILRRGSLFFKRVGRKGSKIAVEKDENERNENEDEIVDAMQKAKENFESHIGDELQKGVSSDTNMRDVEMANMMEKGRKWAEDEPIYKYKLLPKPGKLEDEVELGEISAGSFVGHVALMSKKARHDATITSLVPCTFYSLSRDAIYRIVNEQPSVALTLQVAMAKAIADVKQESGKRLIWEKRKRFLKNLHQMHINVKANKYGNAPEKPQSRPSLLHKLGVNLMSFSTTRRLNHKGSSLNVLSNLKDTTKRVQKAEERWDSIRRLISTTRATSSSSEIQDAIQKYKHMKHGHGVLTPQSSSGSSASHATMKSFSTTESHQATIPPNRVGGSINNEQQNSSSGKNANKGVPTRSQSQKTRNRRSSTLVIPSAFQQALGSRISSSLITLIQNILDESHGVSLFFVQNSLTYSSQPVFNISLSIFLLFSLST